MKPAETGVDTLAPAAPVTKRVKSTHAGVRSGKGIKTDIAITIQRSPAELFAFWRNFENLPRIMRHVESVQCVDHQHSRWRVRQGENEHLEWEAEIINEHANELIAWRSLPGSEVNQAGTIRFQPAPRGQGTEVHLKIEYEIPGGALTQMLLKMERSSPEQMMREDLRHFKQLMEAGEIPTTRGQPAGRRDDKTKKYEESK